MALFDPGGFARQLCERWEHIPLLKTHHRPPAGQLATILEQAYLASLESEEGRPLRFGLILRGSNEPDEPEYGIARFDERRPLSSNEIRRLAPATGLSSTFIGVECTDRRPFIWGTVDVGSEWTLFQSAEQTSGMFLPDHLVITVSAPGTISLKFSDFLLYSVEHGRPAQPSSNVLKFGPVHEFFRPVMHNLLREAFPDRDELISDRHFFISYGGEYLRFLARTLKCAEGLGHGGTIIVLRGEGDATARNLLSIKYPISGCQLWDELVRYVKVIFEQIESAKLIDGKPQVERELVDRWKTVAREQEKLSQRLIDRSRFLARLTQVDGALVMTERLQVLGFGAVIQDLSQTHPTVRSCEDERCRAFVELKRESYGTRHRSAIELCERVDCLVFVLSQDGRVKALICEGDQVLLWPSVLLDPRAWFVTAEDVIPQLRERRGGGP
jgi:hypothetical protein